MTYSTLENVSTMTVADNTWAEVHGMNASHVRVQADKAFYFVNGSSASGGFNGDADTPYVLEIADLSLGAPLAGGTVTFKIQRVLERR